MDLCCRGKSQACYCKWISNLGGDFGIADNLEVKSASVYYNKSMMNFLEKYFAFEGGNQVLSPSKEANANTELSNTRCKTCSAPSPFMKNPAFLQFRDFEDAYPPTKRIKKEDQEEKYLSFEGSASQVKNEVRKKY